MTPLIEIYFEQALWQIVRFMLIVAAVIAVGVWVFTVVAAGMWIF